MQEKPLDQPPGGSVLLSGAFRPFFLLAAVHAVIATSLWAAAYTGRLALPFEVVGPFYWHAHEMVFGFVLAVVAGFVLTAIERWTGVPRVRGAWLIALATLWTLARALMLTGDRYAWAAGLVNVIFIAALGGLTLLPIVRSRRWPHLAVLGKVAVLALAETIFVLGCVGVWGPGARVGLYLGFYTLVGLVLTTGFRMLPMFLHHGLDLPRRPSGSLALTIVSTLLLVGFLVAELTLAGPALIGLPAAALCVLYAYRLTRWHFAPMWRKPLLWGLYLSLAWITVGFGLRALAEWAGLPPYPALHAFAYGGLGGACLAMMMRVSIGHTGGSIHQPPPRTTWAALLLLNVGAVVRVILPILLPDHQAQWVLVAQGLWSLSFLAYGLGYARRLLWSSKPGD